MPCDTLSHPQDMLVQQECCHSFASCMAAFGLHPFVSGITVQPPLNTTVSLGTGWEVNGTSACAMLLSNRMKREVC